MKRIVFVFIVVVFFNSLHAHSAPMPVENFAHLPDVSYVNLSPNGKKLSSIVRIDVGETNGAGVQVTDLETGNHDILLFSDNTNYFLGGVWWKDDHTLLATTWYPSERDTWVGWTQARYKTREVRLLIIDVNTGEVRSPFKKTFLKRFKLLPTGLANVVDSLPNDPDHILMSVASANRGFPGAPMVYKINIKNQRTKTIQNPEDNTWGWDTDQQSNVRLATWGKDEERATIIKDIKSGKWEKRWPYEVFSEDEVYAKGFGNDPNILYLGAYHKGFMAVFKVDLRDKDLKRELVFSDNTYDVTGGLVYSPITNEVIGIGGTEEGGTTFFTKEYQDLQASINKALPNTRNFVYSLTDDEKKFLVYSTGPTESGTYYIGERNPTQLKAAAYRYKKLPPEKLNPVTRIEYKARDGLDIEAYLTLPKDGPKKNLPALMFPHGGPMSRDSRAFDYWAQFFADRGYAVLQMNFRGGDGQGVEFRNSGLKKWGKEMQDDIEDGALKLVDDGIADINRICIVGASYGGYAALMGIVKTPDFYKCSISVNGVSNVLDLVIDNRAFWRSYNIVEEMIGDDHKELKEISPVNYAEKIKVPVLLIHGENDRQVEIKHSYQMRDALQKAGKDVVFIEQENEDHYLTKESNRVAAFKAMNDFLKKHLPVD